MLVVEQGRTGRDPELGAAGVVLLQEDNGPWPTQHFAFSVADADLEPYVKAHQPQWSQPERRRLQYVLVTPSAQDRLDLQFAAAAPPLPARWSITRVNTFETPCMSKIASFRASRESLAAMSRDRFSVSSIATRGRRLTQLHRGLLDTLRDG